MVEWVWIKGNLFVGDIFSIIVFFVFDFVDINCWIVGVSNVGCGVGWY